MAGAQQELAKLQWEDPLLLDDRLGDVLLGVEVVEVADGLPVDLLLLEDRPEGEADGREGDGRHGDGARDVGGSGHEPAARDGLAFERAGVLAVGRVLRFRLEVSVRHGSGQRREGSRAGESTDLQITTA